MSVVESSRVAPEANLHINRAKEETATTDVIARGGRLYASRLLEPHMPTATGGTLETAKVNTLDTKEPKGLLEENPQKGQKTMNSLAGVVSLGLGHARETLAHVLSLTVQCYNRVSLSAVDVPPGEHSRNERRGP